ncbi:site-specific integrase [Neobacillus sp. YIM B02564]|uniref:Site-specific integrase n=1 Tax=Neobacillus paridis TaxID=2803862 RepID=A0ABS1TI86_9BACI|nr:site-specific integrase [Neobacillus paridis]MBL4951040.1 site-specific integrase [Neobacillus paridis]
MKELYNEELKEKFLSTYNNEPTQETIRNVFRKTYLIENTLEKDMFDMNLTQLGKCIENTNPSTSNAARANMRFISNYLTWCTENGYRKSNINPLKTIDVDWADQFIDKTKKIHFSYNEFINLLEDKIIMNYQDKALMMLMWNGIIGEEFSQLRDLKYTDINFDNHTIYVKERDYHVPVDKKTLYYLEKTNNEKTYYNYNQVTKEFNEKELLESPYVFKIVKSPRGEPNKPVGHNLIYRRIHILKELLELHYLTPQSIKQSGMIYESVQQYIMNGELGYKQFEVVGNKYDYSKITTIDGKYEYYNTFLMKEFINPENIKELYNINLEIKIR